MKRGRQLLDLPVIDLESGKDIGEVIDVIFNPQLKQIEGLKVRLTTVKRDYWIPYQKLYRLGEDAITINNQDCITKLDIEQESLNNKSNIIGSKVMTKKGDDLGVIEDIVLNERGNLIGYELTDGLIQDILEGREILSLNGRINYGEDTIIVSDINQFS